MPTVGRNGQAGSSRPGSPPAIARTPLLNVRPPSCETATYEPSVPTHATATAPSGATAMSGNPELSNTRTGGSHLCPSNARTSTPGRVPSVWSQATYVRPRKGLCDDRSLAMNSLSSNVPETCGDGIGAALSDGVIR